jgi:hypothetical protein
VDCRRPFATFLILLACVGARASSDLPIREAQWIVTDARLESLTNAPGECFKPPPTLAEARLAAFGRVAFRTPMLLGGQAARVGLSCASCHRNGRGNPVFQFPGLSGAPGTADVTASLMSRKRGDGVFNPRVIPDLVSDPPKIARDPARPDLENFINGLVTEEFDGPPPPPAVRAGLAAYVRSLTPANCPSVSTRPINASLFLEEALGASDAALDAWQQGDPATARLMIAAARTMLSRIDERYGAPSLARERALIRRSDDALRDIQRAIDAGEQSVAHKIDQWQQDNADQAASIVASERRSLFNRSLLKRALSL